MSLATITHVLCLWNCTTLFSAMNDCPYLANLPPVSLPPNAQSTLNAPSSLAFSLYNSVTTEKVSTHTTGIIHGSRLSQCQRNSGTRLVRLWQVSLFFYPSVIRTINMVTFVVSRQVSHRLEFSGAL